MGAYHQMGDKTESMILEPGLNRFKGMIQSPVNYDPTSTIKQCDRFREKRSDFDILFDPQLYFPQSERGKLPRWSYVPKDLDTTDPSIQAWQTIVDKLIGETTRFSPNGLCSPAAMPRAFSDEYYDSIVTVANYMAEKLKSTKCRPILTALVGLADLGRNQRHLTVGSILSKFRGRDIYLVLADNQPPRLERTDSGALEGVARLIRLLVRAGYEATVGFTSTEMILWKAAGAQNVASGKFFNLRRFTTGRWEPEGKKGGTQLWYWTEPSLLAFLREADINRFLNEPLPISPSHAANPYSQDILKKIKDGTQKNMLADSWRQYLFWMAQCDAEIGNDIGKVAKMLDDAKAMWGQVEVKRLKFEEEKNTGGWIHPWSVVINELERRPD